MRLSIKLKLTPKTTMTIIALTGATGFIGRHLTSALSGRGYTVRALTRSAPPISDNAAITWIHGSFEDKAALADLVDGANTVVHCAGAVKARDRQAFLAANTYATAQLLRVTEARAPEARLIHISSLVAREPSLSDYAGSKWAAEDYVGHAALSWTILRPPAIYGPGDLEILKIFKSLKYGVGFVPGSGKNRASILYVADLVAAIMAMVEAPAADVEGRVFELDDGAQNGYSLPEIYETAANLLSRTVRTIEVPATALTVLASVNLGIARLTGAVPMVTPGKIRELTHPDWVAKSTSSAPKLNHTEIWQPSVTISDGLRNTLTWYRQNGLF